MNSITIGNFQINNVNSPKMKLKEAHSTTIGIPEADIIDLPFAERNRLKDNGDWFYPNRNLEPGVIFPKEHTINNLAQGSRWNLSVGLVAGYNIKADFSFSDPMTDGNCDLYLYPPSINISDPGTNLESTYVAISTLAEGEDETITYKVSEEGNYTIVVFHTNPPFSTHLLASGTLSIKQIIDDAIQTFYTEGEISPGVISNYSDVNWLFPYSANPIYASIPSSIDSDSLYMIEASSTEFEEISGNPGEDLYIENDSFIGDTGIFYRSQTGQGFVSLWGIQSGIEYQIIPLQSPSRSYSKADLKLQFYLLITEEGSVELEPSLKINGETSEETIDYTEKSLSTYLSLISINIPADYLDQGSINLALTSDYSFDFQVNSYGNYYPIESEAVRYKNPWTTTQNSTIIYVKISENETTVENVIFNYKSTTANWNSVPMTWIEPSIFAANISSNQINATTVEWNLTIVETASLNTEPIILFEVSTEDTELDLAESTTIIVTGSVDVFGISALNTAISVTSDGSTSNTSDITFGGIPADSSKKFALEITFDETGSSTLTITLTADNHPDIVEEIEFIVSDSIPAETTDTTETTTTTTTTTAQTAPGFTILTLTFIGILLVPWRKKTQ